MAEITSLTARRQLRKELAALSPEERATVAATAAHLRMANAASILRIARERLAEVLAWAVAESLELGQPADPYVTLAVALGDDFLKDALLARAEELRKRIPKEAETLQRLLEVPVALFPAADRIRKQLAQNEASKFAPAQQPNEDRRALYEAMLTPVRARNDGWITPQYCEFLLREFDKEHLTSEAAMLEMICVHLASRLTK